MSPDHPSVRQPRCAGIVLGSWGRDGDATLYLAGELDIATAPRVSDAIDEAIGHGARRLAFDGSRVDFIDLSGVHPLLEARSRLRQLDDTTRVWWQRPAPSVRHLLATTGLGALLPEGAPELLST